MPYITREDGERFIIPSYRDTISAKKPSLLKKEIVLLSSSYGEYITLQRKNIEQYEVAFSPEAGYLLGETVWHYFKRPMDLIYCEAIPNTTEAILVIVKGGSVYLDGSFPIDSIADELIIFRTQQNNFDIHIFGDVPISKDPEPEKISLDASSVRSFEVLTESAFAKLPRVKAFHLQLVDAVLKAQGIGVLPVKGMVTTVVVLGLVWMAYNYIVTHKKEINVNVLQVVAPNPYDLYISTVAAPDPVDEITALTKKLALIFSIPGWTPVTIDYTTGFMITNVTSTGVPLSMLYSWAARNLTRIEILPDGIYLGMEIPVSNRMPPITYITSLQQVVAVLTDRLEQVIPGNVLAIGKSTVKGKFSQLQLTINFSEQTLDSLEEIGRQFAGLPVILSDVKLSVVNSLFSGSIVLNAVGN